MSANARARILPPYVRRVDDTRHRILRLLLGVGLVLFAMAMGFFIALFGLFGWYIYAIPLVILFLVALWLAPDVDTRLDGPIARTYFIFMAIFMMWPNYIAINLPGVPWISFERLAMFALAGLTLYALATSRRFRGDFAEGLTHDIVMFRLFAGWTFIQFAMLAVTLFGAFGTYLNDLLFWSFLFAMSAWMMRVPGQPMRLFRLLIVAAVLTGIFGLLEAHHGKPIWIDHVPSFLGIEPSIIETLQTGRTRGGELRVKGIYRTSPGNAEFIGMAVPLALWAIAHAPTVRRAVLGIAFLALLFQVGLETQSRTAMVSFAVTIPAFVGIWALRRFRTEGPKRDIIGPAFVWLAPMLVSAFAALLLLWPRARVAVFGGSMHRKSNAGRERQWDMAIPEIIDNPLGYGIGTIEKVVPNYNWAGIFTIDSYPIVLLVEYGVIGFLVYVALFVYAIYLGIRTYIQASTREEMLAGAFAVSLCSFLVTRTVLAAGSQPVLAFAYAGMITGLALVQKKRLAAEAPAAPQPLAGTRLPPRVALARVGG
ncbi:MAG: O-antigen ligase family protein [Sphingomonadaceae bacterium]